MLQKITYAGTACRSFVEDSAMLHHLADLTVDPTQVERVTEREVQTAAFRALPLVDRLEKG